MKTEVKNIIIIFAFILTGPALSFGIAQADAPVKGEKVIISVNELGEKLGVQKE